MGRFVLRFRGAGPAPTEDVDRLRSLPNATVIDESSGRMLLLEAPEQELKTLIQSMPEWVASEERFLPLPDPRPKPRRSPPVSG